MSSPTTSLSPLMLRAGGSAALCMKSSARNSKQNYQNITSVNIIGVHELHLFSCGVICRRRPLKVGRYTVRKTAKNNNNNNKMIILFI